MWKKKNNAFPKTENFGKKKKSLKNKNGGKKRQNSAARRKKIMFVNFPCSKATMKTPEQPVKYFHN